MLSKFDGTGIKPIAIWDNGFKQISNNRNPLRVPADFADLKFRIMPSDVIRKQFTSVGSNVIVMPFNEVFHALEKGAIDGQENTFSNIASKNFHYVQNYLTVSNHAYLGYVVLMNEQFWNDLPEDIQQIVIEVMEEVSEWEYEISQKLNKRNFMEIEQCDCIEIHVLTEHERQQWEDAMQPVYQWMKDHIGDRFVESLPKYNK